MLKSLEFENFKSWGGRHRLDFWAYYGFVWGEQFREEQHYSLVALAEADSRVS